MKTSAIKDYLICFLARNRRNWPVKQMAWMAESFLHGCENYSYNFQLNGENMVLERLKDSKLQVFFDVGANRGDWTKMVRVYYPKALVHLFEIAPPMHPILDAALKDFYPPVKINHIGLSNEVGTVKLNFCTANDGRSTIMSPDGWGGEKHDVQVDVPVITGDSYAEKQSIGQIDFLKIDVEGAEILVLKGFSKMLQRGAIKIIQFEYCRGAGAGVFLKDFYVFLESLGYSIGKIFPDGVEFGEFLNQNENSIGPNFLAVHKSETDLIRRLKA